MHIVGIRLRNWMRFRGEFELPLTQGVYAITAQDSEDPERSNYLGKSSIPAAIRWCLEGKQPRDEYRTLDQLISNGQDEMQVDVEFSDGTWISRYKKRGKSADLLVNDSRGEKAQLLIDPLFGISIEDRLTTCWAEQRELSSLVRLKSTPLTEMVESWLGTEKLVEAESHALELLRKAQTDCEAAQRHVIQLTADGCSDEEWSELCQEHGRVSNEIQELEQKAKKVSVEAAHWVERKKYTDLLGQREELRQEIERDRKSISHPQEDPKLVLLHIEASEDRGEKLAKSRSLRLVHESGFDGQCPVSTLKCPAKAQINADRETLRKKSVEAKAEFLRADKDFTELDTKLQAIKSQKEAARYLEKRIEEKTAQLEAMDKKLDTFEEDGIDALEEDETYPTAIEIDRTELNELRATMEQKHRARKALPEARKLLEQTKQALKEHLAACSVLGPEGARRKVVENTVESIWSDATNRLQSSGIDLTLTPSWSRETGMVANQCECGWVFGSSKTCNQCGKARGKKTRHEFTTLLSNRSGAAEDLAGFALRVAAFQWLKVQRDVNWSICLLDEPTAQMDRFHRRALGTHIIKLLGNTFEQGFVISHTGGILESVHQKIQITGDGQWSRVEVK